MAFLEVSGLHKIFVTPAGDQNHALKDVSFEIEEGEILSVVGHNGSGKTTLFNCIRQTLPWDGGDIRFDGISLVNRAVETVSVYQDVCAGVVLSMTPLENLSLVFSSSPPFWRTFPTKHYKQDIENFLEVSGQIDRIRLFQNIPVSELSGGQRQQLAIFMAMMRNPQILLLDEFVTSLDKGARKEVLHWTKDLIRQRRITTLMVTHDPSLAETWGDRILELCDGEIIRFDPVGS